MWGDQLVQYTPHVWEQEIACRYIIIIMFDFAFQNLWALQFQALYFNKTCKTFRQSHLDFSNHQQTFESLHLQRELHLQIFIYIHVTTIFTSKLSPLSPTEGLKTRHLMLFTCLFTGAPEEVEGRRVGGARGRRGRRRWWRGRRCGASGEASEAVQGEDGEQREMLGGRWWEKNELKGGWLLYIIVILRRWWGSFWGFACRDLLFESWMVYDGVMLGWADGRSSWVQWVLPRCTFHGTSTSATQDGRFLMGILWRFPVSKVMSRPLAKDSSFPFIHTYKNT